MLPHVARSPHAHFGMLVEQGARFSRFGLPARNFVRVNGRRERAYKLLAGRESRVRSKALEDFIEFENAEIPGIH